MKEDIKRVPRRPTVQQMVSAGILLIPFISRKENEIMFVQSISKKTTNIFNTRTLAMTAMLSSSICSKGLQSVSLPC
jgi:hypothetical protein